MASPGPVPQELAECVRRALEEDLGAGDLTSLALVDEHARARAVIRMRSGGVLAGLPAAEAAFRALDGGSRFERLVEEGSRVEPGRAVALVEGLARTLLSAERTALNFLGRLSGIATLTAAFVEAVQGTGAAIYDTRKTTPGLRALEKYAVRAGGGKNHRLGLHDAILIKDNHLALTGLSPAEAVRRARARWRGPIEVEVTTADDALAAARAGADVIMLDNFDPERAAAAVRALRAEFPRDRSGSPRVEISGGVTLANVRAFAAAGADRISIGALTHSAPAADVTMDIEAAPDAGRGARARTDAGG